MSIVCLAPKGSPSRGHRGHWRGQLSAGVVESWDTVAALVYWTPPQVCVETGTRNVIRPSSPRGEPDHIWYLVCLWNDFGGIHQSWNLRHGLPVTPVTQGCGAACVCIPPTRGPGARGGSQLTQHSAGCLGPPLNGRELVFPRHLLSNVLSSWATLTQRLRSFLVTSDCVFFRGG